MEEVTTSRVTTTSTHSSTTDSSFSSSRQARLVIVTSSSFTFFFCVNVVWTLSWTQRQQQWERNAQVLHHQFCRWSLTFSLIREVERFVRGTQLWDTWVTCFLRWLFASRWYYSVFVYILQPFRTSSSVFKSKRTVGWSSPCLPLIGGKGKKENIGYLSMNQLVTLNQGWAIS